MSESGSARIGSVATLTKELSEADIALFLLVMGEASRDAEGLPRTARQARQVAPMALLSALLTAVAARHSVRPGAARFTRSALRFFEPAYTDDILTAIAQVAAWDEASHGLRIVAHCENQEGRRLAEGEFVLAES